MWFQVGQLGAQDGQHSALLTPSWPPCDLKLLSWEASWSNVEQRYQDCRSKAWISANIAPLGKFWTGPGTNSRLFLNRFGQILDRFWISSGQVPQQTKKTQQTEIRHSKFKNTTANRTNNTTANWKTPQQTEKHHSNQKNTTANSKTPQQTEQHHSEFKNTTANRKTRQQTEKHHSKLKKNYSKLKHATANWKKT